MGYLKTILRVIQCICFCFILPFRIFSTGARGKNRKISKVVLRKNGTSFRKPKSTLDFRSQFEKKEKEGASVEMKETTSGDSEETPKLHPMFSSDSGEHSMFEIKVEEEVVVHEV